MFDMWCVWVWIFWHSSEYDSEVGNTKAQEKACADLSLEHRKSLDVRVQDAGCRLQIMSWSLNQSACHLGFGQTWSFAWKFKAKLSLRKIVGFSRKCFKSVARCRDCKSQVWQGQRYALSRCHFITFRDFASLGFSTPRYSQATCAGYAGYLLGSAVLNGLSGNRSTAWAPNLKQCN